MNCRHCNSFLEHTFLDLGFAPPSNAYLKKSDLAKPELYYPLKLKVCDQCWLVQTEDCVSANELFSPDYAYFSSTSSSWVEHAKQYSEQIINLLELNENNFVIEIASNDGYLLKNFVNRNIPCLGIEPTDSTADESEKHGVPVLREFFGQAVAQRLKEQGKQADLVVGNNVYAHVPAINDFTNGLKTILKPGGVITLEFPHLMKLIEFCQFDTVYHEHFSYLSLYTVSLIFKLSRLKIFNVEQLDRHGGSLRIYGCHESDKRVVNESVSIVLTEETNIGLRQLSFYRKFQSRADYIKNELLLFLLTQKKSGKTVVAYGAAAKGNTLLNYAGIKPDILPYVVDAASSKQGKFLPGSHIPIYPLEVLEADRPDFILVLPWNLAVEIRSQLSSMISKGSQLVVAVPDLGILK